MFRPGDIGERNGFVRQTQLPVVKRFKYFKIHVDVLLSFDDVTISKGEFSELDKIAIFSFARGGGIKKQGEQIPFWVPRDCFKIEMMHCKDFY